MISIVMIAKGPRVLPLVSHFQELVKAKFIVVDDYEAGLQAVFDKRPNAVFIQGNIGQATGEAVAKHIKGLLRENSPRVILLGGSDYKATGSNQCYDDSLDFTSPEEDLYSSFRDQLDRIPFLIWNKSLAPKEPSSSVDLDPDWSATEPFRPFEHSPVDFSYDPTQTEPPSDLPSWHEETPATIPALPEQAQAELPLYEPVPETAPEPEPETISIKQQTGIDPPSQKRTEIRHIFTEEDQELPPFETFFVEDASSKSSFRVYVAALIMAVAVSGGIYYFLRLKPKTVKPPTASVQQINSVSKQVPAMPNHSTAVVRAKVASLPKIIIESRRDPEYPSKRPGWQRYAADGVDFLVYSEASEIKAVQGMATGNANIGSTLVSRILSETLGVKSYAVSSESENKGYMVATAALADGAELALYRRKQGGGIRGFVISVP